MDASAGTGNLIRDVSDTALWVAVYRAMESERPDALFKDPFARRLAGNRGQDIVDSMPHGKKMAWAMVIRTAVMDELILRCIKEGARTVLNLAAGLDTRAYRLDLPGKLRWFHVDFPHMTGFMQEKLAGETARCQLEYVAADLREPAQREALFRRAAEHGPVLVITEGLLVYLPPEQVASLAASLKETAEAVWWITDLATPLLLNRLDKLWAENLAKGNSPFLFAPDDSRTYFSAHGWREAEFRSTWTESLRLKRPIRYAGFWNLMMKLQPKARREADMRMSGIALLQPD
jgi:methyltransferase (TIGR00027 family)